MSESPGGRVVGTLSIGEVLSLLKREFPDITISKIRFLEA
ncbi:MAG: MerR family transcriptional regulator, partial [Actinobacteria bacterium]|nr:MerR family transcriptional regulator [Actinomycetota bacterium]